MNIIQTERNYPETKYVARSLGEYIQIDMNAAGYSVDDITIEARENGVLVVGKPNKDVAGGELLKGFSNFYDLHDPKKFDRAAIQASLFNGILTLKVPVKEEFRTVKINVVTSPNS